MNQQINLYEQSAGSGDMAQEYRLYGVAAGGILLVAMLVYVLVLWQQSGTQTQLADVQQRHGALKQQFEEVNKSLEPTPLDTRLEQEVLAIEKRLRGKQAMVRALKSENGAESEGFSHYLHGLANRHVNGLWLTKISLYQGGTRMGLEGKTDQPEQIPALIRSLGEEVLFKGTEFDIFNLEHAAEKTGVMDFSVSADWERK